MSRQAKPWWRSRTLAVNALAAGMMALEASLDILQPLLGEAAWPMLASSLAVVNAALRVVTTGPLRR